VRKSFVAVLLTIGMIFAGAGTANAGNWTTTFGFDGCSWQLSQHTRWAASPWAEVWDTNGGCSYLTVWANAQNGTEYHTVGPVNGTTVNAGLSQYIAMLSRGRAVSWEHGWAQTSGWYVTTP